MVLRLLTVDSRTIENKERKLDVVIHYLTINSSFTNSLTKVDERSLYLGLPTFKTD